VRKFRFSINPARINLDKYRATLIRLAVARPENNYHHWRLGSSWTSLLLLVITFNGYHDSLANQVYARHAYLPQDVQQNASFVDIVTVLLDGGRVIDLSNFKKWVPNTLDKLAGEYL
jgi:hypothetical protein